MKNYKALRKLGSKTVICRNKRAKVDSNSVNVKVFRRKREVAKYRERVLKFFERDDNSPDMPGKVDCI